jgi:pre-mRNA-splicing factor 38B
MGETMEIWGNASTYNLNTATIQCIRTGSYWERALTDGDLTFHNIVDEIYSNVTHLEPYSAQVPHRIASTAFCCLYKLFTMRLTKPQLTEMIEHKDSPYIRAIGFLYLRFVCEPKELWDWFAPYIADTEELTVPLKSPTSTTIGDFLKDLLSNNFAYHGTQLPRIPVAGRAADPGGRAGEGGGGGRGAALPPQPGDSNPLLTASACDAMG